MIDPFARVWWILALRGLAGLALAVVSLVWPRLTLEALLVGFGVYVAVDSAAALYAGLSRAQHGYPLWPFALEGALGLVFGAAVVAFPDRVAFHLWYLVAGWALATGLFEVLAAVRLRRARAGEPLLLTAGGASLVLGLVMALWPRAAMVTLAWLVGAYAALFGLILLALALKLRRLMRHRDDDAIAPLAHSH